MSVLPCPNCGRLNRPGARFCASCQASLTGDQSEPVEGGLNLQTGGPTAGQVLGGGDYRVVRPLGKGGMGAVWLVAQQRAFDRLAVVKEVIDYYDPADSAGRRKAAERFEAEARTLAELKHPGIPDLYAFFSEAGHNYLVMEYIEGHDLSNGLSREDHDTGDLLAGASLPAEEVIHYTIEICEVLEYLARRQPPVVHNDIKPGNIIIDSHSGRAVLVDFGTARTRYQHAGGQEALFGTVGYAAPELYQGHSESRSDVYSLGATAYHLLTDDDPGDHPGQYPKLDALPHGLGDLLRPALSLAVDDRPSAEEFRQSLEGYLAGAAAPMRGLPFPDRSEAATLPELVRLATRHWSYTAGLLQDGLLVRWLRGTLRDAASARAAEAAAARWTADPDAALDDFLRQVAPATVPAGRLELHSTMLSLAAPDLLRPVRGQIELANRGAGYLRGRAFSTQAWLRVARPLFGCPPGGHATLEVEADPAGLASGRPHIAAVTLEPDGGTPEVIPVQLIVAAGQAAEPARAHASIRAAPDRVDLGSVSRSSFTTGRQRIVVTNLSQDKLHCRVVGAPDWLQAKPSDFRLAPGRSETLELVGRVSKIPAGGEDVTFGIAVDGGATCPIHLSVRVRGR